MKILREMSSEVRGNADDLLAEALKATDDLYDVRDTYFSANPDEKASKLLGKANLALQLLDEIPSGIDMHSLFSLIRNLLYVDTVCVSFVDVGVLICCFLRFREKKDATTKSYA